MRQLVGTLALFGLVLGLAAAVALHSLPAVLVGQGSFFAYAAPGCLPAGTPVDITLQWAPSLLTLGGLGLALGAGVAVVLARLGWRLTRSPRSPGAPAAE